MDTPQPPLPPYIPPPAPPSAGLSALFDFSFTHFITISFIKVIYALALLSIALLWFGIVAAGFFRGFMAGIAAILVATVVALLYTIMARVWLEFIVVVFRIGDNTSTLVELSRTRPPTPPQ